MLSTGSRRAWAKSGYDPERRCWSPLWLHLLDTAGVARLLARNWLTPTISNLIQAEFAESESGLTPDDEFVLLASWIAGVHDIGKATPAFSSQVPYLDDRMREGGLDHTPIDPEERRRVPHALAGQLVLERWLKELGWGISTARALASIVGAHHGIPALEGHLNDARGREPLLGDYAWQTVHAELLDLVAERTGAKDNLQFWAHKSESKSWSQPFLVELSGLVILADWLASSETYFPLLSIDDDGMSLFDCDVHERRVETGWSRVELPSPWHPCDVGENADFLLNARFDLPDGTSATAAQRIAVKKARDMGLPGMLIVQETTGSGKTEAALMSAEIMAARTGRSGVLFALPTQATTDAMFSRELDWLSKIESSYRANGAASTFAIQLQHGRARLNEEAGRLRKKGYEIRDRLLGSLGEAQENPEKHKPSHPYDIGRDEDSSQIGEQPHRSTQNVNGVQRDLAIMAWFTGRKKSMLSDFVVTTVDHVLFSSMRAPHLALRHLGLSRKIVVVDEVHSYSTYMNNYLERALTWLASYGVPVILLSATLSEARCASFADAYRRGLRLMAGEKVPKKPSPNAVSMPFPSLATVSRDGMEVTHVEATGRSSRVRIERLGKDDSLTALLGNALADGGCALVVRNTVRRAQETYEQLREVFGEDVSLNHARFTISDRLARDADLLRRFGSPRRRPKRPHRAIVVATQVVEQSLDVDFDLLITDLAPIDLILQRMGRLHRHRRTRPKGLSHPVCYIDWLPSASNPDPRVEPGAETIYGEHDMLLTAAALNGVLADDALVAVPDDVRELVEAVYGDGVEVPAPWAEALEQAREKARKKKRDSTKASKAFLLNEPVMRRKTASLVGWLQTIADDSEEGKAQVRDGEDSLEVILLERRYTGGQEELCTLSSALGASSSIIPVDRIPDRSVVRAMAMSEVRLPPRFTNSSMIDRVLDELEESCFVPAWQACPDLRGRLFLPLTDGRAQLAGVTVEYTSTTGLMEVNENDTELQSA